MTLNVDDLTIGQSEIYFHETAASPSVASMPNVVSLGNIVSSGITPDITTIDHFIRVKGEKKKDKEFNIVNSMSISFKFDEINKTNVQRLLMGGQIDTSASRMSVGIKNGIEGRVVLRFATDVGRNFLYVIPKCNLKPDGSFDFMSDKWMEGSFKMSIIYHPTYHVNNDSNASLAPFGYLDFSATNIINPF